MRTIIAAFNMTIDGNCDHTVPNPDSDIHHHYSNLLRNADAILYGRITYKLMQYWQSILDEPSEDESMNDFAIVIDKIPKIVFSSTLKTTGWQSAHLSDKSLQEKVIELKNSTGSDILIGSRSLIIQLLNLNLIDELQLCVYPIIAGPGLSLFDKIEHRINLTLRESKTFKSGAVIHFYTPKNE